MMYTYITDLTLPSPLIHATPHNQYSCTVYETIQLDILNISPSIDTETEIDSIIV